MIQSIWAPTAPIQGGIIVSDHRNTDIDPLAEIYLERYGPTPERAQQIRLRALQAKVLGAIKKVHESWISKTDRREYHQDESLSPAALNGIVYRMDSGDVDTMLALVPADLLQKVNAVAIPKTYEEMGERQGREKLGENLVAALQYITRAKGRVRLIRDTDATHLRELQVLVLIPFRETGMTLVEFGDSIRERGANVVAGISLIDRFQGTMPTRYPVFSVVRRNSRAVLAGRCVHCRQRKANSSAVRS